MRNGSYAREAPLPRCSTCCKVADSGRAWASALVGPDTLFPSSVALAPFCYLALSISRPTALMGLRYNEPLPRTVRL